MFTKKSSTTLKKIPRLKIVKFEEYKSKAPSNNGVKSRIQHKLHNSNPWKTDNLITLILLTSSHPQKANFSLINFPKSLINFHTNPKIENKRPKILLPSSLLVVGPKFPAFGSVRSSGTGILTCWAALPSPTKTNKKNNKKNTSENLFDQFHVTVNFFYQQKTLIKPLIKAF